MIPERERLVLIVPFDAPLRLAAGLRLARRRGRDEARAWISGCPLLPLRAHGRSRAGAIAGAAPEFIWAEPPGARLSQPVERVVVQPTPNESRQRTTKQATLGEPRTGIRAVARPGPESPGWITSLEWRRFSVRERTVEHHVTRTTLVPLLQRALAKARTITSGAAVMASAVRPLSWTQVAVPAAEGGRAVTPAARDPGRDAAAEPARNGVRHGDPVPPRSRPRPREATAARPRGSVSAAPNVVAAREPRIRGEHSSPGSRQPQAASGDDAERTPVLPVRRMNAPPAVPEAEVRRLVEREMQRRLPPKPANTVASDATSVRHAPDPVSIDQLAVKVADRLQRMAREDRFRAGLLR